jgi:PAS domain S-box-containing protein
MDRISSSRSTWGPQLLMLVVAGALVLTACYAFYYRDAHDITTNALDLETRRMDRYSGLFAHDIADSITDLRLLSTGDGFQTYLATGQADDLARAVRRAVYFSKDNPDYDQLRYIDEKGQEIIRVNHDGMVVAASGLQNKSGRSYFELANGLNPGEIFISRADLNVERGVIEQPLKPTIRVAIPVFDAAGHRRGIYVINILAANLIDRLRKFVPRYADRLRMLNADGYWLAAVKPEEEWGFQMPARSEETLAKSNPELWTKIEQQPTGQEPLNGGYFTWSRAVPTDFYPGKPVKLVAEDPFLVFASMITPEVWEAQFTRVRQTFTLLAGLLLILSSGVTWFFMARRRANQERDRFFNLTRDMLCIAGFDGVFKRVNPAWEKALGYTADEIRATPFIEFVHPDDKEKTIAQTAELAHGGEVVSFENRYRHKDGSYRWLLWSARPIVEDRLIYGSARDLTERKQIEEKLTLSEERLRLMIVSVEDYSIFMLDPAGRVMSWNAGAQRSEGYTSEEIVGKHFSVFYPEDRRMAHEPDKALLEAAVKGRFEEEGIRVRKDGSQFWANVNLNAIRNNAGELIGFVKVTRDISVRRRTEEALRASEERSRSIIESAHDGFISIDTEGRIREWNRKAEDIFGWTRAEVLGQFLHEKILPEKYRAGHVAGLKHLQMTGEGPVLNKTSELSGLRRSGEEFPLELVIWPLTIGSETTYHSFLRDITARKEAEARIRGLNDELQQRATLLEAANRELESFSYSVSHDLRAPLRHIHGFVELLQKTPSLEKDTSAQRYMGVIAKAAKEMGMLIDDLLAFSRTGRVEMRPVKIDMQEMVQKVIHDQEMETQGRKVNWVVKPLSLAPGDAGLMRLVWMNLLGNAVKYTRPREEAVIEVGEQPGEGPGGREIVYYVKDNGVGFDMQYATKLFGVFQRLHRSEEFEGTGIGLANVQRIILRHGGRVWAESQVDAGATFYFSLPVNPTPG